MGSQKHIGKCKLCGQIKEMTFEHVPPRVAFNKTTKHKSISIDDFSKIESLESFNPKGRIFQGGIGYYALCKECNSFLGRNYVRSYENWVKSGYEVLSQGTFDYYKYIALNQAPLKILKQIASMIIVMNEDWFIEEFPELVDFVNNPNLNILHDKFKIFLYLNNEGQFRYCKFSTSMIPGIGILNCSELTFPPFGYVMTFNYEGELPKLLNITDWKNFSIQTIGNLGLGLSKLPTHLPFLPLDYRQSSKVNADIKAGNEIRDRLHDQQI